MKEAIKSSKLTAIESKLLEGEVIYTTPLFKSQNDLDLAYPSTPLQLIKFKVNNLSVDDLKFFLKSKSIKTTGRKDQLISLAYNYLSEKQ